MEPRAQVSPSRVVFMPSSAKASAGRDRKKLGFCFVLSALPFGEMLSPPLGLISLKAPLTFLLDFLFGPLSEKVL